MLERFELDGETLVRDGQLLVNGKSHRGGVAKRVMVPQPHGFVAMPVKGAQGVVGYLNGDPEQPVLLGYANPGKVPEVGAGGTAIYDANGAVVSVVGNKVRHVAAEHTFVGAIFIEGDIMHTGNMTSSGVHQDANGFHT
jgi:phage gp45-like